MKRPAWRTFPAVVAACSLAACAGIDQGTPGPVDTGIRVEGFAIHNGLPYPVTEVMFLVPETGVFVGCGNILPRTACRSEVESTDYFDRSVQVRWKEHGEEKNTDEFKVDVPDDMAPGTAAELEVVIFAPGQAGASLVRKSP